ncbi:MAG: cell division protein FtsX [Candidatus Dormibacteria bacterium]
MLSSALFAPRAAAQNFWRNKGLSMFAVSVMTVVLMMVGISLVLGHSFDQTIQGLQSRASTISIFLSDNTPTQNVWNLDWKLRNDPRVRSVTYVSKTDALNRYKNDPTVPPEMISGLDVNPLPASLDVDVRDIRDLNTIADQVKSLPLLDATGPTNYRKDVIDKLVLFSRFIGIAGIAILVGLTAIAVFIIMMSIRTAVYVRRKEIEVMKLVGATDWFVRGPFLLEGVMAGLIASVVAIAVVAGGYHPLVDKVHASVSFLPLSYDAGFIGQLTLSMAAVGMLLGALGSYLGVRRFLQT